MKIKTAIIGLGKISWANEMDPVIKKMMDFPTHFSVLREDPHFQLVAAQDISGKARNAFKRKALKDGLDVAVYSDWQKMIKAERPELVVVATNTASHVEICSKLIDLGIKNILCEKPLSYSFTEAEKLVDKADKKGCVLFVNYFRAFNDSYLKLIQNIENGLLGKIQSFDAKYSRGILNNGTHLIDLLTRMFGEIKTVKGFKNPTCNLSEKDPTVGAFLEFQNGTSGYMHGLSSDHYYVYDLDIMGELGVLNIVFDKARLLVPDTSNKFSGFKRLKDKPRANLIDVRDRLYPVYENIYSCLRKGGKNKCSGRDSLKSLLAADKIIRSIKK
jgi:predicted dehydrogenase